MDNQQNGENILDSVMDTNLVLCGKVLLEHIGKNILHLFAYKKEAHLTYHRVVNRVLSNKCQYTRIDIQLIKDDMYIPDFDKDTEFLVGIMVKEKNQVNISSVKINRVREISSYFDTPVRCIENSKPLDTSCRDCGCEDKPLHKCSGCGIVKYCSKECQQSDWRKQHKNECNRKTP
jgi:hypothetical protein